MVFQVLVRNRISWWRYSNLFVIGAWISLFYGDFRRHSSRRLVVRRLTESFLKLLLSWVDIVIIIIFQPKLRVWTFAIHLTHFISDRAPLKYIIGWLFIDLAIVIFQLVHDFVFFHQASYSIIKELIILDELLMLLLELEVQDLKRGFLAHKDFYLRLESEWLVLCLDKLVVYQSVFSGESRHLLI